MEPVVSSLRMSDFGSTETVIPGEKGCRTPFGCTQDWGADTHVAPDSGQALQEDLRKGACHILMAPAPAFVPALWGLLRGL